MAYLSQLRVENFRAFRSVSLDLGPHGLSLIAGPNNAGKSALLSVFDVLAGTETPISVRHAAGGMCRIYARWNLTDDERAELLGNTPETAHLMRQHAVPWIEWEFAEFHSLIQPVAISTSWPGEKRLEFARIDSPSEHTWKVSIAKSPLATWDQSLSEGPSGRGGSVSNTLDYLNITNEISIAERILFDWRQGYFHFKPLRESKGRESPLAEITPVLEKTGSNLAKVLLYLHNNDPDLWRRLVSLVQEIVPGVGLLMTPVRGSVSRIEFRDEYASAHHHNLKDLGTGVEQLLMTLVMGLTRSATTVLLEEPETGLHPGAQRALLSLLQDWSKERTFIASTHSATMLDWTSPTTDVVAVNRAGLVSTIDYVTAERTSLLQALGARLSDVLSAECILIVEGASDKDIFDVWFPQVIRNPRVVVVDGGGGYNARHADLFTKWLEAVDRLGVRRVLYARDRDELPEEYVKKLEESSSVYVLPCRELENLLLDFEAIHRVLNSERLRQGKQPITPAELRAETRRLADELRPAVVLKRVMADLAEPVRLVDNDLRRKLAKVSADRELLTARVLERIPEKTVVDANISRRWQAHSEEVNATWDERWMSLVPGADLLSAVWKEYLDRGYSKPVDGIEIARQMASAPVAIAAILGKLMVGDEPQADGT